MFKQLHSAAAVGLFLAISGLYLLMAWQFPVAYIWGTYEDLLGEWVQVFLFAGGFAFALMNAIRGSNHRLFFGILALALFYTVMEEISWGQRIFGWSSPEIFREYNLQRETNLHNLLVGPYSTVTKEVVSYALAIALFAYGLIYPVLMRLQWQPAVWFHARGLASPPLYLAPFFVAAAWLETAPLQFNEAEVAEILVGVALFAMTAQYWFAHRHQLNTHTPPPWSQVASRSFARILAVGLAIALGLAASTTWWFYHSPQKRPTIENRLLNGYEKFAGRYENYQRWHNVTDLYTRVNVAEPNRTSILRALARAYRELGDQERFLFYTNSALEIALDSYARNPDQISVNLALARTYRQLGNTHQSREYAQQAHDIALARATKNPDSARAAYWLGQTYRYLGDNAAARAQFQKAFELRPSSKKYRKAYYDLRQAGDTG